MAFSINDSIRFIYLHLIYTFVHIVDFEIQLKKDDFKFYL